MLAGDVLKAVFSGTVADQTWNLVQAYVVNELVDAAVESDVARRLFQFFDAELMTYLTQDTDMLSVRVDNMTDNLGFGEFAATATGGVLETVNSPFSCFAVKQIVNSKLTRAGFKFLPGIPDSICIAGKIPQVNVDSYTSFAKKIFADEVGFNEDGDDGLNTLAPVIIKSILIDPIKKLYEKDWSQYQQVADLFGFDTVRSRVSRRAKTR